MKVDLQGLSKKAVEFWNYLQDNPLKEIVPAHIAKEMGVTNRTITRALLKPQSPNLPDAFSA